MIGETDLDTILKNMNPKLNEGEYVFCVVENLSQIDLNKVLMIFKEQEAFTLVLKKEVADSLILKYSFVASWITLDIHSSLEAVGFTAAFSKALTDANISSNVVAAFFHDHVFVNKKDEKKAMEVLNKLKKCKI